MAGRTKTGTLLLVLAFTLVWVVVLAPATVMTRWLPVQAPLVLQGITGTVWSGAVAQAALTQSGQVWVQGRLSWQVRPLSFLRLSPCVEVAFADTGSPSAPQGTVTGIACVSAGGDVTLRDVSFDLPARYFLRSADLRLGGEISGLLTALTWQAGSLTALTGQGLWSNARIVSDELNLSLQSLPFDFRRDSDDSMTVQLDNGDLLAQQTDTPLHVSLRSTVTLDGSFHTRAQLTVQSQTPDSVIELLDVIAEPQGAGLYTLEVRSQP